MNPYLLGISAFGFFSDLLKNKEVRVVLILLLGYVGFSRWQRKRKEEEALKDISNPANQFAIRLHSAFHPWVEPANWWLELLPDGTDEEEVIKIATEMGRLKNFTAVANSYKSLYKQDLTKVIGSEGVGDQFFKAYGNPGTGSNTQNWNGYFKPGHTVKVKTGYNMRNTSTGAVLEKGDNKTEFIIDTIYVNKTVSGIKGTWVALHNKNDFYGIFRQNYYVFIDGLIKV